MFVRLLVSAQCIVSPQIAVWLAIGVPFLHGNRTCGVTVIAAACATPWPLELYIP